MNVPIGAIAFAAFVFWAGALFPGETVRAAASEDTLQVLLTVEEKQYQLMMTLLDEDGNPIEGAKVTLYSEGGEEGEEYVEYSDERGVVKFEDITIGQYRVVIEYDGKRIEQKITLGGEKSVLNFIISVDTRTSLADYRFILPVAVLGLTCAALFVLWRRK